MTLKHLPKLLLIIGLVIFTNHKLYSQLETKLADDDCQNRQIRCENQLLYLPAGYKIINFKFNKNSFMYGIGNGIWKIVQKDEQDTIAVWADIPMVYDQEQNDIGVLKNDTLLYGPNAEIRNSTDSNYSQTFSISQQFKAILYYIVDFDSIDRGGRCTGTGYYFAEWKPVGKPFNSAIFLNIDSFNLFKKSSNHTVHCENDFKQFGTFKDSASGDLLRIEYNTYGISYTKIFLLPFKKKKWLEITPTFPKDNYRFHLSPFYANSKSKIVNKNYPGLEFIFMRDHWITTGIPSNSEYYPDHKLPKGIKPIPGIPMRVFNRMN